MAIFFFMKKRAFIRIRPQMLAALFFWVMVSNAASQPPQKQVDEYNVRTPKTVIELQQFRKTSSIAILKSTG